MDTLQAPPQTASPVSTPRFVTEGRRLAARALSPARAMALPAAFAIALVAFALLSPIRQHPSLLRAFLGAGSVLLVWVAALLVAARRTGRVLTLDFAAHRHHWAQACAQMALLLYWGWHARFVYGFLPLIFAQLVFAYAVDILLTWSRRNSYTLGFGPFPIVFSINLFLWFKPEWFHWQFAIIGVGYLAKEFIRWTRDGRSAHIFNPSSFPLAVASLALIVTGATEMTFGKEIALTFSTPPHIYLFIFLVAFPGQLLFGVSRMTVPAVVTLYTISQLYLSATGTYLFYDTHIPVPVFLGMLLLFTDPSTAPRTELGRILFGVLYALGTATLYAIFESTGVPTFYDKLLPVPILNLMVRRLDLVAGSSMLERLDPSRLGRALTPMRRNLVYASIWASVFAGMSATRGVGDGHPGRFLPFWEAACEAGSTRACEYAFVRKYSYCAKGSGWACNELGIALAQLGRSADAPFKRGCDLGFSPACQNAARGASGLGTWARARPLPRDLPIVLRSREPTESWAPDRLYALACEQGWPGTCDAPKGEIRS